MTQKTKAIIAALICNVSWGFSFIFIKTAQAVSNPIILLTHRFILAFIVLNIWGFATGQRINFKGKRRSKEMGKLVLTGFLYPVLYFICESFGVRYSSATFSGLMVALIPVTSAYAGAVLIKEKPTMEQYIFSVVSLVGVALVSISPVAGELTTAAGVLFMIGAVATGTGQSVLARSIANTFSTYERTFVMMLEGCIAFLVLGFAYSGWNIQTIMEPLKHKEFIIGVIYLGVISSVVAMACQNYAFKTLTVSETTAFTNLTTVISVIAGIIILHEPFNALIIPSTLLIVVGVWGVQIFTTNRKGTRLRRKRRSS